MAIVPKDFRQVLKMSLMVLLTLLVHARAQNETQFTYTGFKGSVNKLHLDGLAKILPNGLLEMTNITINTSHALYPHSVVFKQNHLSFSTTFVFAMYPQIPHHSGQGIVFVISPSKNFQHDFPHAYLLGLFNSSTNGLRSNHVFAVELDTIQDAYLNDIDGNHVGIDVNSLESIDAATAAYYSDKDRVNKTLALNSRKPMQVWIDYDEVEMLVNVTLAPFRHPKPSKCLLSKKVDLSKILLESMYVGFSSVSGLSSNYHYILGWSWNQSGKADLDLSNLPSLPRTKHQQLTSNQLIFIWQRKEVTLYYSLIIKVSRD